MNLAPQPPRPFSTPADAGVAPPAVACARSANRGFYDVAGGKIDPGRTVMPAAYGLTTDGAGWITSAPNPGIAPGSTFGETDTDSFSIIGTAEFNGGKSKGVGQGAPSGVNNIWPSTR